MLKTTTKRSLEFGTTSVLAHARLVLLVELLAEGGVVGVSFETMIQSVFVDATHIIEVVSLWKDTRGIRTCGWVSFRLSACRSSFRNGDGGRELGTVVGGLGWSGSAGLAVLVTRTTRDGVGNSMNGPTNHQRWKRHTHERQRCQYRRPSPA